MQFGLIDIIYSGPHFGTIAHLAIWCMISAVLVMLIVFVRMLGEFSQIRRRLRSLIEPIVSQLNKDGLDPGLSTSPSAEDPLVSVYAMAMRQELSGQSPIAIIEALKKTIDLLGRRLERMIFYSRILGSSTFLVGFIGALVHTLQAFRAAQYIKDVPIGALAVTFSEAIILFLIALFIGIICLAGSYWSRIRLSSLNMTVSDRILKAAEERAAKELKSDKR